MTEGQRLLQLNWVLWQGRVRGFFAGGAVWVSGNGLQHQAILFLCQHLVVVVPEGEVVHNMHEAYERLDSNGEFDSGHFGTFLSGPSKTADIEQSLVIGAQGARSLVLLLVGR